MLPWSQKVTGQSGDQYEDFSKFEVIVGKWRWPGAELKINNVKGKGEVNLALISVLGSHNCAGRKPRVSLKDSDSSMGWNGFD